MAVRKEVYEACVSMARQLPAFFSAYRSTGGGKNPEWSCLALQHVLANRTHDCAESS